MSRLSGIPRIGLGAACWPSIDTRRAFYDMLTLKTVLLILIGLVARLRKSWVLIFVSFCLTGGLSLFCGASLRAGYPALT